MFLTIYSIGVTLRTTIFNLTKKKNDRTFCPCTVFVSFVWISEKTVATSIDSQSKAWVCGRSLAQNVSSNPTVGMDV